MKTIDDICFKGKRVLVRVDFNVPHNKDGIITDDTRIKESIPTIKKILNDGGSVVLISHMGRPKGKKSSELSLEILIPVISKYLNTEILFVDDSYSEKAKQVTANLKAGQIVLLENLRFYNEEEKGDIDFAKHLSSLADIYVNDAFGTAHRAHASTTIIANFFPENKFFGYLLAKEVVNIKKLLTNTEHPFTAIIGGAKVSSKISIITTLIDKVDNFIIGGGMAFTFIKALGGSIGNSLVEDDKLEIANEIMIEMKNKNINFYLPSDAIIADSFSNNANIKECDINFINTGWLGLDIGKKSIHSFSKTIIESKTILWNGPMGVFEMENFNKGTIEIAKATATATKKGAYSLVGGGDSVSAIKQTGLIKEISYLSTGGGAMLEYIEGKELPGIQALL